jgi:hypothetical protein
MHIENSLFNQYCSKCNDVTSKKTKNTKLGNIIMKMIIKIRKEEWISKKESDESKKIYLFENAFWRKKKVYYILSM